MPLRKSPSYSITNRGKGSLSTGERQRVLPSTPIAPGSLTSYLLPLTFMEELIKEHLSNEIFHIVGRTADAIHRECYVVGGYVRDIFLHRPSKDIDFVTVGSGIEVAEAVAKALGKRTSLAVFRNFGTAQVKSRGIELEFVGARRESYDRNSRKPIVEDGSLDDDQRLHHQCYGYLRERRPLR